VGIYIVLVLKEVRESVRKVNAILNQVVEVSKSVSAPIIGASGLITGLLEGLRFFQRFRSSGEEVEDES